MATATAASASVKTARKFDPPGPGSWEMDAVHFPRAVFGSFQVIFPKAFSEGFQDCCARYGMLLESMDVRFVHGFPYLQPRIVGVPQGGGKPPPKPIMFLALKLMLALHPQMRRRMAIAKTIFERRPWLGELRDWDERVRPATIAGHRAICAVEVESLDDDGLAKHLLRVEEHGTRMLTQDHSYNLTFMVPLGDYLAHAREWTGLPQTDLMQPLRGCSDVSAGDIAERRRLLTAIRADASARAVLEGGARPDETLRKLAAHPGEVGEAMRDYLVIVGNSLPHGLELESPTVGELPGPALAALRAALAGVPKSREAGVEAAARVRAKVPEAHRAQFDVLLGDAQLTYRLRDERHLYGVMPIFGIARRAVIEAGRRLVGRGLLPEGRLAFLMNAAEVGALLRGEGAVPPDLAERNDLYRTLRGGEVPARLGPDPGEPPPSSWMPNDGARRMMTALDVYMRDMQEPELPVDAARITGLAVSRGVYEGTARLCFGASDLENVRPGDVLVAPLTSPAINVVLPILGAIVTDKGGALSHAAIVSREYGIPGVVGTRNATKAIPDGARVRVDGDAGVVTVLA